MSRTPLRMPKMSMTMAEGELATWHVSVGDVVEAGQVVCEVMTDKVDMDVEATASGTVLELVAEPGDTVPVGEPLAWLDVAADGLLDDLLDGGPPGAEESPPESADRQVVPGGAREEPAGGSPADEGGIVPAIPRARRLAAENGVDLRALRGSGAGGAVLVSDVRSHLEGTRPATSASASSGTSEPQHAARQPATSQPASSQPAASTVLTPRTAEVQPAAAQAAASHSAGSQSVGSPAAESGADATSGDALWAARAASLVPRPGSAEVSAGGALWRDVVLGTAPTDGGDLRAALAVALSRALAAEGPPHVRRRPRVGLAVATPAGPVTVTFSDLHRLAPDAAASAVRAAVEQARAGSVDVGLLAPPDAVVTWVPDADRVAPPAPDGPLATVGAGAARPKVVPVGDGIGVRAVLTLGVTAAPDVDLRWTARLLARTSRELAGDTRRPWSDPVSMTESSRS